MKKLSVVTAYYNRKELFIRTLKTINNSKYAKDIEVIVVDDGSREEERLEDLLGTFNFDFKVIKLLLLATTQNNKIKLPIMADPFGFVLIPGLRYKNNPSSNLSPKL